MTAHEYACAAFRSPGPNGTVESFTLSNVAAACRAYASEVSAEATMEIQRLQQEMSRRDIRAEAINERLESAEWENALLLADIETSRRSAAFWRRHYFLLLALVIAGNLWFFLT